MFRFLGKITPGLIFLTSIIISYIIGCRILQKEIEIQISDNSISIDKSKFEFSDLISYSSDNTNYVHKLLLNFSVKKIRLYVWFKHTNEYLIFKKDIENKIISNNKVSIHKIAKQNWYEAKSAKLYGYITASILLLWISVMIIYPEKLKVSNMIFFLLVLTGLAPILFKIFRSKQSK